MELGITSDDHVESVAVSRRANILNALFIWNTRDCSNALHSNRDNVPTLSLFTFPCDTFPFREQFIYSIECTKIFQFVFISPSLVVYPNIIMQWNKYNVYVVRPFGLIESWLLVCILRLPIIIIQIHCSWMGNVNNLHGKIKLNNEKNGNSQSSNICLCEI